LRLVVRENRNGGVTHGVDASLWGLFEVA
jgi:hypothetical protein